MTDQLTPQTQRQHFIAQDAGNAAYSAGRKRGDKSAQCYAAYRTAYQASLAEQQAAPKNIRLSRDVEAVGGLGEIVMSAAERASRLERGLSVPQQAAPLSAAEVETDLELTRRIWRETPADEKGY